MHVGEEGGLRHGDSAVIAAILLRFRRRTELVVGASWLSGRNDIVTNLLDAAAACPLGSPRRDGWRRSRPRSTSCSRSACYTVSREAAALRGGQTPLP